MSEPIIELRPSGRAGSHAFYTPRDFAIFRGLFGQASGFEFLLREHNDRTFAEILDPVSWFTGVPSFTPIRVVLGADAKAALQPCVDASRKSRPR